MTTYGGYLCTKTRHDGKSDRQADNPPAARTCSRDQSLYPRSSQLSTQPMVKPQGETPLCLTRGTGLEQGAKLHRLRRHTRPGAQTEPTRSQTRTFSQRYAPKNQCFYQTHQSAINRTMTTDSPPTQVSAPQGAQRSNQVPRSRMSPHICSHPAR